MSKITFLLEKGMLESLMNTGLITAKEYALAEAELKKMYIKENKKTA